MIVKVKNSLPKEYKDSEERRKEIQRVYIEVQNAIHTMQTSGLLKEA